MEAPTPSETSAVTMIAPKFAVMIDDLSRVTLNDVADPSPDELGHPSGSARGRALARRRTKSRSEHPSVPVSGPMTCSTCRITYLPTAVPPLSVAPGDWDCDRCAGRTSGSPTDEAPL